MTQRLNLNPDLFEGGGIFDKVRSVIRRLPSADENVVGPFAGEKHQILKLKDGRIGVAQWSGPGTDVSKRLHPVSKPRETSSIKPIDEIAMKHDLQYFLSTNKAQIKKADKRMVRNIKMSNDSEFNLKIPRVAIGSKIPLEDAGIIDRGKWVGGDISNVDRKIAKRELRKLNQKGYGNPAEMLMDDFNQGRKKKVVKSRGVRRTRRKPDPYKDISRMVADNMVEGEGIFDSITRSNRGHIKPHYPISRGHIKPMLWNPRGGPMPSVGQKQPRAGW